MSTWLEEDNGKKRKPAEGTLKESPTFIHVRTGSRGLGGHHYLLRIDRGRPLRAVFEII